MAPENIKGTKRKGAVDAAPKPKKQKKSEVAATDAPTKVKAPRKKAEEIVDADTPMENSNVKEKKSKKTKTKTTEAEAAPAPVPVPEVAAEAPKKSKKSKAKEAAAPVQEEEVAAVTEAKKSKKAKAAKKEEAPKEPTPEVEAEEEEVEEDDQTAALLAGFESEGDESDADKEDDGFDVAKFQDKIPKGLMKKLKDVNQDNAQKSGVIYIGRLPHGFYEPQMKAYFSQFGRVNRLRVSRNKKTGASKHYAFVEFASSDVGEIVAKTMDKYLMFGHILQCRVVPTEQVNPELFKGANQRFKSVPRNKMAGKETERGSERAVWEKRVAAESKKRNLKAKALKKDLGYEYTVPALKTVDSVPVKAPALESAHAAQKEVAAPVEETPAAVEAAPVKKSKKAKKAVTEAVAEKPAEVAVETAEAIEEKPKKAKKAKKAKAPEVVAEEKVEEAAVFAEVKQPKAKKDKKRKSLDAADAKPKKTKKSKA